MTAPDDPTAARLAESWVANADAWTAAVRDGAIPSRRAGTDAAIVAACADALPAPAGTPVLDLGCGEGWLARALALRAARVTGADGLAPLVEAPRAPDPASRYAVAGYDALVADDALLAGPFDLVALNFALLGDPVAPLLAACARRLAPGGRVVIQTVHPWAAAGDGAYADGWREETFAAFAIPFPMHMPWYFRTLAGWVEALAAAGLRLERLGEPVHPDTRRPLSLVLTALRR
ncbi:methyltransferase domain-containing protein [Roseisolibacter sp. H3M3-2]|uniref:class I SAM-dependent methyltransferase n=1 Tax=Roseisolibacter sp. H3M3-2 TaxID=3031323 RepID=UPI0023DB2644|nr:methyltransferase domain-containing protein [Roseisolibacter sp. H3M3-2]MDF1503598.1 methyltransferase domain-containing protein [Roseisolibacter sp. H3M3-2]